MHETSNKSVRYFKQKYTKPGQSILDVGGYEGADYRDVFAGYDYKTLNICGIADFKVQDDYNWPGMKGKEFDVVMSTNSFEHMAQYWRVLMNMAEMTKSGGLIFIIAPSAGPIHGGPVDCYRFYPHCARVWAKMTDMELVETTHSNVHPWCDLMVILKKK